MEMIRDLYDYKGWKIQLRTPDGSYEGVLSNLSSETLKVTLRSVFVLPERKIFLATQHYYSREIISYGIVPGSSEKQKEIGLPSKAAAPQTAISKQTESDVIKDFINECYSDDEDGQDEGKEITLPSIEELLSDKYTLELPENLAADLPLDHVIIDEIGCDFHTAIRHIKQQAEIGVAFEGDNIGRFGQLYFVTISTVCCTFVFDVYTLKKKAFSEGLKEIMESSDILKVMHDSRQPSDALYHLFAVRLENVFDTQVGDVFGTMQNSKPGKVGSRVRPLHVCLMRYLRLTKSQMYPKNVDKSDLLANDWTCRPLSNTLLDQAIKNVIYLRLLKSREYEYMMQSFHSVVDVYLNVLRNASVKELELEPSSPDHLPEAVLSANVLTYHMKDFGEMAKDVKKWDTSPTFACPGLRTSTHKEVDRSMARIETGSTRNKKRVQGYLDYANYMAPKERSSKEALKVAEEVPLKTAQPTCSQRSSGMPRLAVGMVKSDDSSSKSVWPTTKESIEAVCGRATVLPNGKLKVEAARPKSDRHRHSSGSSSVSNSSFPTESTSSTDEKPFVWPKVKCERRVDMSKVIPAGMDYGNFRNMRISC